MRRTRRDFLRAATGAGAALLTGALGASLSGCQRIPDHSRKQHRAVESRRPNIIIILADDLGYSDVGCFGSEINTPNLDKLAHQGVRFTHMYNSARCCPSRACLLTGVHPHQAGIGGMVDDRQLPAYRGFLQDPATIAEVLRDDGYRTFMSGKWHVGGTYQYNRPETWRIGDETHPIPVQRGFESHYGIVAGGGSYYKPPTLIRDTTLVHDVDPDYYFTDALSDEAISMIGRAGGEPFFLYLAYTAPHWPLHALEEDIAKYAGVYEQGWDQIRLDRYERLRATGVIDGRWPMSPRDSRALPWADAPHKHWEARRMATYAAQVSRMDDGIGRIMQELSQRDLRDNTLIVFVSDNGGSSELLAEDGPKRPGRFDIPTRDGHGVRIGNTPDVSPGPEDTFQSYDLPWANVSCTPFRLFKRYVHEGGISTPCIACWPGQIPAGTTRHDVAHFIDLMPTCLDAAQVRFPDIYKGKAVTPLGGHSLLPAMRGQRFTRTEPLYWEHEGNRAIRDSTWKLVAERNGPWELYDMSADRMELTNLADREPGRVRAMGEAYESWAQAVGVAPPEVTP